MMTKSILFFFIAFIFCGHADSQITKGNWLVGGNANFSLQQEMLNQSNITGFSINAAPDIGYFIIDKFAAGAKTKLSYRFIKLNGPVDKSTYLGFGPFLRYYFLSTSNRINIFAESAYQYSVDFKGHSQNDFNFSAGPVIYFNTSVGLEFAFTYDTFKGTISGPANTFSFGIGFQIHLEKE